MLTEKQQKRIEDLFASEKHVEVEAIWGAYQRMVSAYRGPERAEGKQIMVKLIDSFKTGFPAGLTELKKLGGTLKCRAGEILAYFDRPGTSNGPAEAINGRLENLCSSALGFRNLTNYVARSFLESGGFRPKLHS